MIAPDTEYKIFCVNLTTIPSCVKQSHASELVSGDEFLKAMEYLVKIQVIK